MSINNITGKPEEFYEMADVSVFASINDMKNLPRLWNPYYFENVNIQKFIHSAGLHFDLVINEEFFGDSFLMFAHKYKAPVVTICEFYSIILFHVFKFFSQLNICDLAFDLEWNTELYNIPFILNFLV